MKTHVKWEIITGCRWPTVLAASMNPFRFVYRELLLILIKPTAHNNIIGLNSRWGLCNGEYCSNNTIWFFFPDTFGHRVIELHWYSYRYYFFCITPYLIRKKCTKEYAFNKSDLVENAVVIWIAIAIIWNHIVLTGIDEKVVFVFFCFYSIVYAKKS